MLLIIPIVIICVGMSCIPAVIAIAGGILAVVTEKIKNNPAFTEEAKARKKKKAVTTTIIVAVIIVLAVILITGLAVLGILDIFRQM